MALALDVGVSPRHLGFVENGRSKPSPELVLALADRLEVPLRERNAFLLAAGYAPRYQQRALNDESMTPVRRALRHVVDTHAPYPAVVIDRLWNSVMSNDPANRMVEGLPDSLMGPPTNVFRVSLHPDGLATRTRNFADWAAYLLGQLRRLVVLSGDPDAQLLADEVSRYQTVIDLGGWRQASPVDDSDLLVPWRLEIGGVEHAYFTTITTFGTPQDITLAELAIELFYPADDNTDAILRAGERNGVGEPPDRAPVSGPPRK